MEKSKKIEKTPERLRNFTIEDSSLEDEIILGDEIIDDGVEDNNIEKDTPKWKKIWNKK